MPHKKILKTLHKKNESRIEYFPPKEAMFRRSIHRSITFHLNVSFKSSDKSIISFSLREMPNLFSGTLLFAKITPGNVLLSRCPGKT